MPLRFHWRLLQRGETSDAQMGSERVAELAALPDLDAQLEFCRQGERCGIDSFLVDINYGKPDPMVLALALAGGTARMKFMVAHRPGLMSPTLFVQQVNSFAALSGGRITLNIVAGHSPSELRFFGDFLSHDERYERMDEFLSICHLFWRNGRDAGRGVNYDGKYFRIEDGRLNLGFDAKNGAASGREGPEIYLGGNSPSARRVATRHATCWMRFPLRPEEIRQQIRPVLESGTEVGLRMCVMVRSTREKALAAACELIDAARAVSKQEHESAFVANSDSHSVKATFDLAAEEDWLAPGVWTGAVRYLGAPWIMFLGSPQEIADAIMAYAEAGVSQFILSGWPKLEEMVRFGETVIPLVREMEEAAASSACRTVRRAGGYPRGQERKEGKLHIEGSRQPGEDWPGSYVSPRGLVEHGDLADLGAKVLEIVEAEGFAHLQSPMTMEEFEALSARVGEIQERTDLVVDAQREQSQEKIRVTGIKKKRPGVYQHQALGLHTDRPTAGILGWYCVEQDAEDGSSLLLDTREITRALSEDELEALRGVKLSYTIRHPETREERSFHESLISTKIGGDHAIYYAPWHIVEADATAEQSAALEKLSASIAFKQDRDLMRIRLSEGECLFIDNRRLLHGRGDLSPDSKRHLVRLYIGTANSARP